jgi:hypothetical protein
MSALEEASFIQTWILELTKPHLSVIELIEASPEHTAQIVSIVELAHSRQGGICRLARVHSVCFC